MIVPFTKRNSINERTNVNKLAGKEPWRYIQQYRITPEVLRDHLIPDSFCVEDLDNKTLLATTWSSERYTDFVVERAQRLAEETTAFLRKLED